LRCAPALPFLFTEKIPQPGCNHCIHVHNLARELCIMSSKDLIHSVNNQLAVVMAQAEMLARENCSAPSLERCQEIKDAASRINSLLRDFAG